jgi:creatinine amidohydrolase
LAPRRPAGNLFIGERGLRPLPSTEVAAAAEAAIVSSRHLGCLRLFGLFRPEGVWRCAVQPGIYSSVQGHCNSIEVKKLLNEPVLWEWLTSEEIGLLGQNGMDMAILPVGSTEQHGPHLTVNVDSISAQTVAFAVSAKTGIPVLPTLPYGSALGHTTKWPGTLSLTPTTLTSVVVEIGEWLFRASGFTRLVLLNGHTTNFAPLRCAVEIIRFRLPGMRIALRGLWEISPRVSKEYYMDAEDWHANAAETSLMLALHDNGVRVDRIADDADRTGGLFFAYPVDRTSINGATGTPTLASAEDGRKLFSWQVEDLTKQLMSALTEDPPFEPHDRSEDQITSQ